MIHIHLKPSYYFDPNECVFFNTIENSDIVKLISLCQFFCYEKMRNKA